MQSGAAGEGSHPVAAALAQVRVALQEALDASTVGMTQAHARELLVAVETDERRMHAVRSAWSPSRSPMTGWSPRHRRLCRWLLAR